MNDKEQEAAFLRIKQKYPHLSDDSIRVGLLIADRAFENVQTYTTSEIIRMASKQRARCNFTALQHEKMAVDMAILVKICRFYRNSAALILTYAQWNEYKPGTLIDFYKRFLPVEYRNKNNGNLKKWIDAEKGGLQNYMQCLLSNIQRFQQLCKNLPEEDRRKLLSWLE